MPRPRTPIGTFGDIEFTEVGTGIRARVRFRDLDGQIRRVEATAKSRKLAEHRLKERLAERTDRSPGAGELTSGSFVHSARRCLAR